MTRHNLSVCAATAALALALAPAARAQIVTQVIDNFSEEQLVFVNGSPTGTKTASGVVDKTSSNIILGNERDVKATRTSSNRGLLSADFNQSELGAFILTTSVGTTGNVTVTYDGNDNNATTLAPTGLGGVDLTTGGGDSFYLLADSTAGVTATITVYTNATNYSVGTFPIAGTTTTTNYTPYLFLFSSFTVGGGTGANFANVGAISLFVNASVTDTDAGFDLFAVANSTAVPEPGVLAFAAITGTMVAGLVLRRHRRMA